MASSDTRKKSVRPSFGSHRASSSIHKTEVSINVYDLLPAGTISSTLWFLGSSILHTGVVVKSLDCEFAFGGHTNPSLSGVFCIHPGSCPPGATYRCSILQGFTLRSTKELKQVIKEASALFPGTAYNLLDNNCNHFSSFLCERLTGKRAPAWINRAARIAAAVPCLVPHDIVHPPDEEMADGDLVEEEEGEDETTAMLKHNQRPRPPSRHTNSSSGIGAIRKMGRRRSTGSVSLDKKRGLMLDSDGRTLPASERAPVPETAVE
ncbi:MAG: hypothetical protein Q9222_003180 [Ikaeria aurantiellina]